MKIIAVIPDNYNKRFIIEAHEGELAKLIGHAYTGDARSHLVVGNSIKVSEMFDQLTRLASARKELDHASSTLHSIANLLHTVDPLIEQITGQPENKEEE